MAVEILLEAQSNVQPDVQPTPNAGQPGPDYGPVASGIDSNELDSVPPARIPAEDPATLRRLSQNVWM